MGNWVSFWIAELRFDPSTEAKFRWEKGFSPEKLVQDFVGSRKLKGRFESSPLHGDRWFVFQADEVLPRVVLIVKAVSEPHDIWRVVTAFRTSNPKYVGR